jgi:hypothetical protein
MSNKKPKTKPPQKSQTTQDKPKPYPLRSALEGVPPTAHGMSIISSKKGAVVSKKGVIQSSGKITIRDTNGEEKSKG